MRELGWEVVGVEPDPEAARVATEEHGLPVFTGALEEARLPASSFDAITLSHLIEHVPDPVATLMACARLLKRGGKLVALTPCVESLGHTVFRRSWFHLDPPRHLHLFSMRALIKAAKAAKLRVTSLRTISRGSRASCIYTSLVRRGDRAGWNQNGRAGRLLQLGAWSFWAWEEAARLLLPGAGEELLLVAEKPVESN
jgi:SAM-dependent methyltransferase